MLECCIFEVESGQIEAGYKYYYKKAVR